MVLSFQRARKTFFSIHEIIKKYLFLLLCLHVINFSFNQTMIYFQELRMSSKEDSYIPYMLAIAFVGFFVQSGIKVIWTFAVCHYFSKSQVSLGQFVRFHFEKGVIESLRGFLKSIKWGFLLIVPGLIKAIRFQFINFIVCTDPSYSAGKLDALKASEQITKNKFWSLLFLFLFFGILSISTSSSHLFVQRPILVGFTELLSFLLFTFEITYMFFVFDDLYKRGPQP